MATQKNNKKIKIPTFICPDYSFVSKPINRNGFSESSSSIGSKRTINGLVKSVESNIKADVEDIRSIYESIKEFNVNEIRGKSREKRNQDKLTNLGAPPLKNQKVPFKMQMARLRDKQAKEKRKKELLLESGVVVANAKIPSTKFNNGKNDNKKKKRKLTGHDSIQPKVGLKTVKGIFHMKRNS